MTTAFQPSPFQTAIYDAIADSSRGSLAIEAVAGSGKTTTIVEALNHVKGVRRILFLAFNKSIATELGNRVPRGVECRTFHSVGFAALRSVAREAKVDSKKTWNIIRGKLGRRALTPEDQFHYGGFVKKLVGLAKSAGLGVIAPGGVEDLDRMARHHALQLPTKDGNWHTALRLTASVLQASQGIESVADFDDMLYMPVQLGARFKKYDLVLVDEAQDTNDLQAHILESLLARNGRVVLVGDPRQAIYGFRGAGSDSMERLVERFDCTQLPLSVSYRCASAVVEAAKVLCPHMEAWEHAAEGSVTELDTYKADTFMRTDVVICRTAAPLVKLAYGMVARGRGVQFLGRDIGKGLESLVKRLNASSILDLADKVEAWEDREVAKAMAEEDESLAASIQDRAACINAVIDYSGAETVDQLLASIAALFAGLDNGDNPDGLVTLCTVHKSKGLEWQRVFILDPDLMPSRWAVRAWQQKQEENLEYVAITRAKYELCYIQSDSWAD